MPFVPVGLSMLAFLVKQANRWTVIAVFFIFFSSLIPTILPSRGQLLAYVSSGAVVHYTFQFYGCLGYRAAAAREAM